MRQETLESTAARQHALFTIAQALAAGLTARQVEHGARTGRWSRLYRGVYCMAGAPRTDVQRLLAAVLACGPGAMASHRGAAWLWGMGDLALDVSGPLQRAPGPGVTVYRRTGLRPVLRQGVPTTDPLRTVLDLAGTGDGAAVQRALDCAVASRLLTVTSVEAELERRARQGRRGTKLLRTYLAERLDGAAGGTSVLESAMDRLLARHGVPLPVRQYRVPGTGYRLDYAWPLARLAVEVDGYGHHTDLAAFQHDRRRQNDLILAGWTVLRFTWHDVVHRPAAVAAQIRAALGALV